jgi:hypothetical protein
MSSNQHGQIAAKRAAAMRARRLSCEFERPADRSRILAFAAELDAQADGLERGLTPAPATQTQMQMQQAGGSEPDGKR